MNPPTMYASFLVRIWQDAETAAIIPSVATWRVEIEHIQSGQQRLFDTLEQALNFLYCQVNPADAATDKTL